MNSLNARVLQLQDEERRRMARDLHDTVGQEIVVALMTLDTIARTWEKPEPAARGKLLEAIEWLRKVESDIRTFSYLLHPPMLDDLGLGSALSWYMEGLSRRSGINIHVSIPKSLPRLSLPAEIALFRIAQESLSNVIRHSQSKQASVRVVLEPHSLKLSIRDRGRGFNATHNGSASSGVGIEGMRGRIMAQGGTLEVRSSPKGTVVIATVPLSGREQVPASLAGSHRPKPRKPKASASTSTSDDVTRVLIVDDHEVTRKGIRALLSQEKGLEICGEAKSGMEAIQKAQQLAPDLVILDLSMPDGGGFSAAHRIREAGLTPKILVYTTHSFPQLEVTARAAGCDGFVVKSSGTEDLLRGIRAVLNGSQFYSSFQASQ